MKREALILAALALAAPLAATAKAATSPDLSACPVHRPEEGDQELLRTRPLPIPKPLRGTMRGNVSYLAVSTLGGGTHCVFVREMEGIEPPKLSRDGRFLGLAWTGYETGGYRLIDRSGKGQDVEMGARPAASPAGTRLAAIEWSESGFGTLNGVLVLAVDRVGLREIARLGTLPQAADWRLDRWVGENCFEISGVPWSALPENGDGALSGLPRAHHTVRLAGTAWVLGPQGSRCPKS